MAKAADLEKSLDEADKTGGKIGDSLRRQAESIEAGNFNPLIVAEMLRSLARHFEAPIPRA